MFEIITAIEFIVTVVLMVAVGIRVLSVKQNTKPETED